MSVKKVYTLEEVILFLEALEMLHMVYKVEKHPSYYDEGKDAMLYNVWLIEYEQHGPITEEETAIQFED